MTSILVVCTGNICRSPMAEGFLRRDMLRRFGPRAPSVSSAGIIASSGAGPTEGSVLAAGERGTDIAGHRARRLTGEQIREADLVVCMAAEHREAVLDLVPEAASRTFTLKELVRLLPGGSANGSVESLRERVTRADEARAKGSPGPPYDEDIADPLGQPLQAYRGVAWELDELIGRLDVGLFGPRPWRP
jgi:protein-tyrosine phosphatase